MKDDKTEETAAFIAKTEKQLHVEWPSPITENPNAPSIITFRCARARSDQQMIYNTRLQMSHKRDPVALRSVIKKKTLHRAQL